MSRLGDARAALHDALSDVFADPVGRLTFTAGRADAYPAAQPVAPCLWIEQPSGDLEEVGRLGTVLVDTVTFPIAVVYDGSNAAQVAGLDELVSRAWDRAWRVGRPARFRPGPINVGGPSLRATYIDVEMTVRAVTFCDPTPARAEEVPVG